jgi:class 3 adenylate cyclase
MRREAVVLSNFQRYFAPDLARQIAGQEGEIQLGGAKRRVVVLFSDIRGFTSLSERMSPDAIASLLTDYFTEMVEIVFRYGGTLDKFMGDALMALWGAPLSRVDDADRAARAAIAMQQVLGRLNERWGLLGRPELSIGIGINVGEVFAGMASVAIENGQLIERMRREAVVLSNFQRYFAPDLARQIAGQEGEIQLGGAKRQVVVLFSDIRGFTSLSERMNPDAIASLLTDYFTEMVEIVFRYGGTLFGSCCAGFFGT